MGMGQGVRTGLGHGGITCVLQTQFSSFFLFNYEKADNKIFICKFSKNVKSKLYHI